MMIVANNQTKIPVDFRWDKEMHPGDSYFIVERLDACLEMVTSDCMLRLILNQKVGTWGYSITPESLCIQIDGEGNIPIPGKSVKYAHLEKGAVIEGAGDMAVIYSKERYSSKKHISPLDFSLNLFI